MKAPSTAIACILCALFTGFAVTEAGKDTIEVTQGGVTFTVEHYDDGRSTPYRVTWSEPKADSSSTFKFDKNGWVTEIKTDDTKYNVKSGGNSKKKKVKTKGKRRTRNLLVEEGDYAAEKIDGNDYDFNHSDGRRRLYECDDCEDVVDTLVGEGVSSVCSLVDYGEPIDESTATAIDTFCDTFALVSSVEACADECI